MAARLVAGVLAAILCSASTVLAQLRAELIASGLSGPLAVVADPAVPGVLYIVEQRGVVRVLREGQLLGTPFADLRSTISSGGERGLLGMAFAPAASSGRVYFNFTDRNGHTVVARFLRSAADPLAVDPSTRLDLQWSTGERLIRQPFANHNGGHLAFGPDGYLYIALGDGGSGNDPSNNAQNPSSLLGKMLRIDVNVPDDDPAGFRVPPDNPFLDGQPIPAMPEIWSFGFRNPWRYSFDDFGTGATGALIIGDVGQGSREEIDYEPRNAAGRNYGWRIREGRIATPAVPPTPPAYGPLTDPIYDYTRTEGAAVTGGYVYRGTALGPLYRGRYFFADYVRGRVWSLGLSIDPASGEAAVVNIIEHTSELGGSSFLGGIASFGRDRQGELYLSTYTGRVVRIAGASSSPNAPRDVRGVVSGTTVTIRWSAPSEGAVPLQYAVEAGSIPGASDLGVIPVDASQTSVTFPGVPSGTYYVRVRSVGASGAGAASTDVTVIVSGACTASPPPPIGFASTVNGRAVTLSWEVAATVNGPSSFAIEAGSASGSANIAVITVDGALRSLAVSAPPGMYYVRMRAQNACGRSAASNEIVLSVY